MCIRDSDYDWLGFGIYFWEANPIRGLNYAKETMRRRRSKITEPFVVGAVIDLGICLDLTTSFGIATVQRGFASLRRSHGESGIPIPKNSDDKLRRQLDCAVIQRVHEIFNDAALPSFDTVRGSSPKVSLLTKVRHSTRKRTFRLPFAILGASRVCFAYPMSICSFRGSEACGASWSESGYICAPAAGAPPRHHLRWLGSHLRNARFRSGRGNCRLL